MSSISLDKLLNLSSYRLTPTLMLSGSNSMLLSIRCNSSLMPCISNSYTFLMISGRQYIPCWSRLHATIALCSNTMLSRLFLSLRQSASCCLILSKSPIIVMRLWIFLRCLFMVFSCCHKYWCINSIVEYLSSSTFLFCVGFMKMSKSSLRPMSVIVNVRYMLNMVNPSLPRPWTALHGCIYSLEISRYSIVLLDILTASLKGTQTMFYNKKLLLIVWLFSRW